MSSRPAVDVHPPLLAASVNLNPLWSVLYCSHASMLVCCCALSTADTSCNCCCGAYGLPAVTFVALGNGAPDLSANIAAISAGEVVLSAGAFTGAAMFVQVTQGCSGCTHSVLLVAPCQHVCLCTCQHAFEAVACHGSGMCHSRCHHKQWTVHLHARMPSSCMMQLAVCFASVC